MTSINCVGRRYPNAPLQAKGGCLERPPPFWFLPIATGFTGTKWSAINGVFQLCEYVGTAPGWSQDSTWYKQVGPTLGDGVFVLKFWLSGVWRLEVVYHETFQSGGSTNSRNRTFGRDFPNGFPKWPDHYDVAFSHDLNAWPWGGVGPVALYMGHYSQIPVDSCIGVPD